jgi:hypothetical protein
MKKFSLLFAVLLTAVSITPASASESNTIVIIDNGFDASVISNEILELCITSINVGCNNGAGFDSGANASGTAEKVSLSSKREWNHGTIMASIVNQVSPNSSLILIRNARVLKNGSVISGSDRDFDVALDWVIENAKKYNIVAVSFSRGQNNWTRLRNAQCPVSESIKADIANLKNLGVATVIAAGNNRNRSNIDYPACISDSVAISTRSKFDNRDGTANPTSNTNISRDTDFVAYGTFNTVLGPVAESSSAATAAFAGYWSNSYAGSFDLTYSNLKKSGIRTKGFESVAVDVLK